MRLSRLSLRRLLFALLLPILMLPARAATPAAAAGAMHGPRFAESKFSFSGLGVVAIAIQLRYP